MSKQIFIISLLVLVAGISVYFLTPANGTNAPVVVSATDDTIPQGRLLANKSKRYMLSVTLHSEKEINALFSRAEKLSGKLYNDTNKTGIALVLHGPEVGFFTKRNYQDFKKIVDRARKLDKNKIISIKICRTQMRAMKIKDNEIPSFIEIVPYGPTEEKRLLQKGYIRL
jgi:intracellular sulfur oxidation DsrE/DsrF family protein